MCQTSKGNIDHIKTQTKEEEKKMIKLPKDWKDFKIVETQQGVFTGQIYIDSDKMISPIYDDWHTHNSKLRKHLVKYTKQYLERLLGYEITKR